MWLNCPCAKGLSHVTCMLYVCYMFSNHITCFKASVYRGLRPIMLYGYMFLRNSFFIQHRDTACGLRSPRLRGSEVPPFSREVKITSLDNLISSAISLPALYLCGHRDRTLRNPAGR